jgi:hypothetical protein
MMFSIKNAHAKEIKMKMMTKVNKHLMPEEAIEISHSLGGEKTMWKSELRQFAKRSAGGDQLRHISLGCCQEEDQTIRCYYESRQRKCSYFSVYYIWIECIYDIRELVLTKQFGWPFLPFLLLLAAFSLLIVPFLD